jgi:cytochrome o ubiquinol oxidase subunit 2
MSKSKTGNKSSYLSIFVLLVSGLSLLMAMLLMGNNVALLDPKGLIAAQESRLMVVSTLIMLGFAAVILFFLYFFAWRYRETNHKPEFNVNAGRSKALLATAWTAPVIVFIVLASLMLPATQKLEPQRAIASDNKQITIRVIAQRWKWVFLYPEHDVATVNYVNIPVDTPIRFELTADEAPMNSFWIPQLGGMLYAMTEHINQLNLMADTTGVYEGGAAEISGHGFAGMRFKTRVSSQNDFDSWVNETVENSTELDAAEYAKLLEPSENNSPALYYSPTNTEIFAAVLQKYASGSHSHYNNSENTEHEAY